MDTSSSKYHPEPYWSAVAERIAAREGENVIAGDDEPYYRYKRNRFLQLLNGIDFQDKDVLEIGCGPGGNLIEVHSKAPRSLTGADISSDMLRIASSRLVDSNISFHKTSGTKLPFEDGQFDICFTATVLQHNTDETMLKSLIEEICRVSRDKVVLMERIESSITGDDLCLGRPVSYYQDLVEPYGYQLQDISFINTRISYFVSGAIRKLFNPGDRQEGEPMTGFSRILQRLSLVFTKPLDRVFTSATDVARMTFVQTAN